MKTFVQPDQAERESVLVQFWNDTLAPKFIRFRHIMEGGLTRRSAKIMPQLDIRTGDKALKSNPFRRIRREPVGPKESTNEGWQSERRKPVELQPAHLAILR